MTSKQAGWRIYKEQMGLLDHGDGLWEPAPIYSYKRVKLGDVGYIRRGRFHLLFSAGCPLGSRQLGVDVPHTFEPLNTGQVIFSQPRLPGYLCTSTVKESGAGAGASVATAPFLEPGASFSFELTEKQGAALVTKYRTYREDVELEFAFEEYTKRHYDSWVTFARRAQHGNDVKPVLVTGVDMTRDFAMIAYSNNSTHISSEFTASAPLIGSASASVWGTWNTQGLVHTNCGPQLCSTPSPDAQDSDPSSLDQVSVTPNEYNQCVFIRYYTMRWRAFLFPKVIKAGAGPHDCGPGKNYDEISPELTVQSGIDSDADSSDSEDFRTDHSGVFTGDEPELVLFHNVSSEEEDPFDIVARYIFKNSEAEAALIHHRDITKTREGIPGTETSKLFLERQPGVVVDSTGVGRLVHQSYQKRPSIMSQPDSTSLLHGPEIIPPAALNRLPEVRSDMSPIVLRWQHLASMDRQSPDFLPSLASLAAERDRSSTTALRGDDARATLSLIDEVLRDDDIPGKHRSDALCTMRTLAYNSGQIPSHYQADRQSLSVEAHIIASSAFAEVRKGRLGDKTVAVRVLRIDRQTDLNDARKRFCKECIIWMNLSHPNLLELIAVDIDPLNSQCSMISEMMINGCIMEYIGKNQVNRHRLLEEAATGLRYLHKCGMVHGDLKGQNILMTNDTPPRACLTDFGLSTFTLGAQGEISTTTAGGTSMFMAPELLCPGKFNKASSRPTQPADIYAFGMVTYEVLTGLPPFHEKKWGEAEFVYNVVTGVRPTKPANAERIGFGDGTWELVEGCWDVEPTMRPAVDQVLVHLTRVAACSEVVGPTLDSVVNSALSDSSSHIQLFLSTSDAHDGVGSATNGNSIPCSAFSSPTAALKATTALTVPNSSHSKRTKLPTLKLPLQRSTLATKLFVDPKMVNSTIPMPIPLAIAPKSDHSWWRRLINKLKPKRAIGPSRRRT